MVVRPIKTEKDHSRALKEIEKLWGAKEGTPEGDRLDVLATLVEAYERAHHFIDIPDPLDAIRFRLEQMNSDQSEVLPLSSGAVLASTKSCEAIGHCLC